MPISSRTTHIGFWRAEDWTKTTSFTNQLQSIGWCVQNRLQPHVLPIHVTEENVTVAWTEPYRRVLHPGYCSSYYCFIQASLYKVTCNKTTSSSSSSLFFKILEHLKWYLISEYYLRAAFVSCFDLCKFNV